MKISQEKQKKLAYVARRYYLENQRQSDIARELGVSRPMVSRMLAEARELGLQTENLWSLWPVFIDALRAAR